MDLSKKILELYSIVNDLETAYPGRRFTLDGHLIGSIGEVVAAEAFELNLLPNGTPEHDATTCDGRLVQIKATQRNRVALSSCPEYLLVLRFNEAGSWEVVYNGPGKPAWDHAGAMQKTGQRPIMIATLKTLMLEIDSSDQLKRVK